MCVCVCVYICNVREYNPAGSERIDCASARCLRFVLKRKYGSSVTISPAGVREWNLIRGNKNCRIWGADQVRLEEACRSIETKSPMLLRS